MNHKKLGLTFLIVFLIISNSINSIPLFSQIRVMPLGDATVIGTGSANNVGGFRDDLYLFLNAGLIPFDFVGTQNDGVSTDPDHEGHAASTVNDINQELLLTIQLYQPHIVIIHLGTEDLIANGNIGSVFNGLSSVIDNISNFSSEIEIYLSSLIPSRDQVVNQNIDGLNLQLQTLVDTKFAQGVSVYFVDINTAFTLNPSWSNIYMSDDYFPNDDGYGIMAQVILNSLNSSSRYIASESFTDNFNDRFFLGPNWTTHPNYQISNNELRNNSNQDIWDNYLAVVNSVANPNTITFKYSQTSDEFGRSETGVAFLLNSSSIEANGFLLTLNNGSLKLWELIDGKVGSNLASEEGVLPMPQSGDLFFMNWGFNSPELKITVKINNTLFGELSYTTTPPGANEVRYAGIMLKGNQNNNIDDFSLSSVVDKEPPAAINDFALVRIGPTSAQFGFTATGDDSLTGTASNYDLRFSTDPINASNFKDATAAIVSQTPNEQGSDENIFITGLQRKTDYYFAIKAIDENNNASPISDVVMEPTDESIQFDEDFNRAEIGEQWQTSDDVVITDGALKTMNNQSGWNSAAVLISPTSPIELGFSWLNISSQSEIDKIGLIVKLQEPTTTANGYMIRAESSTNEFQLWTVDQGNPLQEINSFKYNMDLVSGSTLKVFMYSTETSHNFVIFVDNSFNGVLSDSNTLFGNSQVQYCGLIFQGNSIVAADNFFVISPEILPASILLVSGDNQDGNLNQLFPNPLVVKVTDNLGSPVYAAKIKYEIIEGDARLIPPLNPSGTIRIEAESGIIEGSSLIVENASNTSGGSYINTVAGESDTSTVVYDFYIDQDGIYKIWGRVLAPSGTEDSFFIQVDDFNEILWDVWQGNQKSVWDWDLVSSRGSGSVTTPAVNPYEINLNKGFHKLVLRNRDINTKLDRLIITRDLTFQPSGLGGNPLYFSNFLGLSEAFVLLNTRSGDVSIKAFLFDVPEQEVIFSIRALPNAPVTIAEFSGNNQTGPAGQVLSNPLVVLASDDFGNPTPNVSVLYELVEGDGRIIENQPVLTDEDGKAAVDLELGKSETNNRVLAHADGLNGSPVEFLATASSGIPTQIEHVSGSNQDGEVGSTLPELLVVKISDEQNNPIENFPVVFKIVSNLGGALSADTVLTNSEGKAQVSFTFGDNIGNYTIHAIALGLLDSPIVFSVSATHGPAFQLRKVTGDSIAGISNFPLVEPFVAEVSDEFGNPVKNISVLFKVVSGGGIFSGGLTQLFVTTDSLGRAGVILTLGSDMSEFAYRVQASSDGLQGSPVEFVATAVSPTAYKITLVDGDSLVGLINKPLDAPFRVRVTNPINEPIKNHPVTFKVIAGGGLFVDTVDLNQTTPTNEDGIASATLKIGSLVGEGSNLVHATGLRGSLPLVGSPVVFTASGKFDAKKISIINGNNQIGVIESQLPQPIEVLVLNSNNNPVEGIPVEFLVFSGGGSIDNNGDTLVVKNTNSNGKASVIFTLGNEAGIDNNKINVTASDGFDQLQGSPISILASAAESPAIKIEAITQTQLTGIVGKTIEPVQVKVVDNENLPVPSHEVKFLITAGNGRITNAQHDTSLVVSTNENGIAEISWTLGTKIGTDLNKIEATSDNGILDLIQSPITFNATTLPDLTDPDSSEIHVTSPTIADNQDKATITIFLRDQFNNPIAGKEVFLSATGELNFFEQPPVTDDAGQTVGHMTSVKSGKKIIHARNVDDNIEINSKAVAEFISTTANQIKLQNGNAQTRNVGTVLANPIVVSVTDIFDNPVPNYPVTYASQTIDGYFVETQPVLTDSLGLASTHYVLSESEGTNIIEAIADGLTGNPIIFSVTGVRNPVAKILAVSGDLQTGIVGDTLNQPLIVEALDANDDPVMGVPVSFQFSAGSGSFVEPQPILSDAFGKATTRPILGPELITQVISAKSSLVQGVTLTFFANTAPSGATQIDLHSGDNQVIRPLEQSTSLTIITRDIFQNPVSGAEVLFEVIEGDAIIITAQPVVSNSSGLGSTIIQAKTTPGIAKIAASLIKNPTEKVVFTVQITSSVAHNIILVSGDQQIGTKGSYLSEPLVVMITDIYNNPVPSEPVAFVVSDGEATVAGDSIKLTNDEGIATSQLRVGENATQIEALAFTASLPNEALTYHITAIENEIPIIVSNNSDLQVMENEFVSFDISVIDPESDPVNVEVNELPDGAVFTKVNAVSWRFDWTPNFKQSGEHQIAYSVADNRGGVAQDTVLIDVINVNRPPMITNVHPASDTTINQGRPIEFSLEITDPDEEELTYIWELNAVEVSQSVSFVYESSPNFSGQDIVEVFVTDGEDTVSFKWSVTVIVSVELVQFNAQADLTTNSVLLHWKTTFEADNLGFDILRSKQKNLGYEKINSQLIPPNLDGNYEFLDGNIIPGFRYYYKLLDKSIQGVITEHGPVQVWFQLPSDFQLDQNFPNPFALKIGQTNTVIQFHMPAKEAITIHIFNTLGQLVHILANKTYEPGIHQVLWDGKDRLGNLVPSGIYYYKLSSGNHNQIKRMILIR